MVKRRRLIIGAVRAAFGIAIVAVLIATVQSNAEQLGEVDLELSWAWLLASVPPTFVGALILPLAWRSLVTALGGEIRLDACLRLWCTSQAARYLPTGIAAPASRVVLACRQGISRSIATASVVLELLITVAVTGIFAAVLLPSRTVPLVLRIAVGAALAAGLAGLPWLLRLARFLPPRLLRVITFHHHSRVLYAGIGLVVVSAALKSLGFGLLALAVLPAGIGDFALVAGAVNAGAIVGLLGPTPGGLGVREGVLAALLASRFGLGDAAAYAVILRAWELLFELLVLGIAYLVPRPAKGAPAREMA